MDDDPRKSPLAPAPEVEAWAEGWHAWRTRVYYEDTDAGKIVYYANYLKFAERARTELLRAGGIDQSRLAAQRGIIFAVKSCAIEYDSPARLDDLLTIRTSVTKLGAASLDLAQNIWRDGDKAPLARLKVKIACLRESTGRPERLPQDARALFGAFLRDLADGAAVTPSVRNRP